MTNHTNRAAVRKIAERIDAQITAEIEYVTFQHITTALEPK